MIELTRTQILGGNYKWPEEHVKIWPTMHFLNRLTERGLGLECIPKIVKVTKNNIHSGKTEDGVKLKSVVVRLKYNRYKYIFLAFNPFDGATKTLWFKDIQHDSRRTEIQRSNN